MLSASGVDLDINIISRSGSAISRHFMKSTAEKHRATLLRRGRLSKMHAEAKFARNMLAEY